MTYTPYLIANFNTGLEKRLQPWLIPDEAQEELFDGYVYRGTISKREGYNYFAIGERNGQPYTESRIVDRAPSEVARTSGGIPVVGNGTPGPYVFRLTHLPVRRGTVSIVAGAQSATDDGLGAFITNPVGGSGTINYTTGDVSITFNANVAGAVVLFATYDYFPGYPVLMIATFITATNVKTLIVADSRRLNIYDVTNNILNYLGRALSITGVTNANPGEITTSINHDLSTGDRVFISGVRGTIQVNNVNDGFYTIIRTGATTFTIGVDTTAFGVYIGPSGTVELIYQASIVQPVSDFYSWVNYADKDSNPRLLFTNNIGQIGYYAPHLTPSVGNYVSYPAFAPGADFKMKTDAGADVVTITCLQMFVNKDRLLLLRTTENGIIRPQRIRISGTGVNSDNFLTSATGAGFIDIPDGTWIQGASFNRDDLIIFTEASTWALKYTGNDTTPFVLDKIDESRGCDAAFSAFTYLNRTSAASPRGLIISDGYRVERQDLSIPDFSYNSVDGKNFNLCFAGAVDADRDHYLLYPPPGQTQSQRILTTNYDEDNYSIYRLPLSCMGTYVTGFDITWADLLKFPNWTSFSAAYGNWNSFAFNSGAPFSLGGGHRGEIWRLAVTEEEDNPVRIRNITKIDANTLEITTDWNNYSDNTNVGDDTKFIDDSLGSDTIFFTAVEGMQEINGQQYPIVRGSVVGHNVFRVVTPDNTAFTAYTGGGTAVRVIPFSALLKQFNPFIDVGKKVRCGWLYMYVNTTGTDLLRNISIAAITQSLPAVVTTAIDHGLQTGDQVSFFGIGGMTLLNGSVAFITVIDDITFSLNGVDSTGFGAYTSGGYASVTEPAKMVIDVITDDVNHKTQPQNLDQDPYQGNMTNMTFEDGSKKWYKIFINQTGKFIQFRLRNLQAGAQINIQATMPGFQPVGRLI